MSGLYMQKLRKSQVITKFTRESDAGWSKTAKATNMYMYREGEDGGGNAI